MDSEFSSRPLVHFAARESLLWRTKLDSDYSWTVVPIFSTSLLHAMSGLATCHWHPAFGVPSRVNINIFIRQTADLYALTAERSTDIDVLDFLLGARRRFR